MTTMEKDPTREGSAADARVSRLTHLTCVICCGVAVQPIPFADIFLLTPIQAGGGYKIAQARGVNVDRQRAHQVLLELAGIVGLGYGAQQTVIGLYKLGLPFLGALTTIPLVYANTYAILRVVDFHFCRVAQGLPVVPENLKQVFEQAKEDSYQWAKKNKAKLEEELKVKRQWILERAKEAREGKADPDAGSQE